jgi:hypothetical protein
MDSFSAGGGDLTTRRMQQRKYFQCAEPATAATVQSLHRFWKQLFYGAGNVLCAGQRYFESHGDSPE